MSEAKLKKLARGHTVQFKHDELGGIHRLKLGMANMKKIQKAHKSGKGVRLALESHEIEGSGLGSFVKKGAKMVSENKQLTKLKDQALDKGLDYALNQAGVDPSVAKAVKKVTKGAVNSQINQMAGSGLGSFVKKGAKMVSENKQLTKLKDQALDKGLDYALNQAGVDPSVAKAVKKVTKGAVNNQINQIAGSGMSLADAYAEYKTGQGIGFKKVMRTGAKALKVGNKISNALGYDDLQDMAIEGDVGETLGRLDPSLANVATNALQKEAGKQMKKNGGSFRKMGGSFRKMGGSIAVERYEHDNTNRIRDDQSNFIRSDHPAYSAWQDNARYFA